MTAPLISVRTNLAALAILIWSPFIAQQLLELV